MHIRRLLFIYLLAGHSAWAQTPATTPDTEIPQTLEQATAQRERAAQMTRDSDALYAAEQAACYKKFLVNSCLDDAKKRHTQTAIEARKLDSAGRDFQRGAKRADVEAKEAKRAANLAVRADEQKAQAETYRDEESAKAAAREEKLAAKARQAEAGRQKAATEEAKRQAKQQKRAQQDAERAAKKAREAEKAAAKAKVPTPAPANQ